MVFYRPVYQPQRYDLSRDTPAFVEETFSIVLPVRAVFFELTISLVPDVLFGVSRSFFFFFRVDESYDHRKSTFR